MSKALKKSKKPMALVNLAPAASEIIEIPLLIDTMCIPQSGYSSWEAMYKFFEDEKIHKVQRKVISYASDSSEATTK